VAGGDVVTGFKSCRPIFNFTPVTGRYYQAVFSTKDEVCYIGLVSSSEQSMREVRREPTRRMVPTGNGVDENSSFCRPDK
jgi:hypothetical protein